VTGDSGDRDRFVGLVGSGAEGIVLSRAFAAPEPGLRWLCSSRSRLLGGFGAGVMPSRAQRLALENDAMRALQQPVEHGIGHGRFLDPGMPMLDGQLTGDQGGAPGGAVINKLHERFARDGIRKAPVNTVL
jgi:hypothetical protein